METIFIHLVAGAIKVPVVVPDPVESRDHSSAVMAATAMQEDWLVSGVLDDPEHGFNLIGTGPGPIAHSNAEKLHSGRFYVALLSLFTSHLEIDHGFDAERCQGLIVIPFRLGTAVETITDDSEILDPDPGYIGSARALCWREAYNAQNCHCGTQQDSVPAPDCFHLQTLPLEISYYVFLSVDGTIILPWTGSCKRFVLQVCFKLETRQREASEIIETASLISLRLGA